MSYNRIFIKLKYKNTQTRYYICAYVHVYENNLQTRES